MWTIINRELAKQEQARADVPDTSYAGVFKQAMEYGTQQKVWKEHVNEKRQGLMKNLSYGTSLTFDDEDLKNKKERFQRYYNKHKGNMDETTLEMGQMMLEDFDIQGEKNKDWNFLQNDGKKLQKDMMYDMQNIGKDAEGNYRTLDANDYEIIKEMQKTWIDHSSKIQTQFADRLELKAFSDVKTGLANAKNINDFLLLEAREDNLIDDRELQAYSDAWENLNYTPVAKYLADQKAGKDTAITFNTNELLTGAKRYKDLYNFYVNDGGMPYKDEQLNQLLNLTHAEIKKRPGGDQILQSFLDEYNGLPQQLRNLNDTNIGLTGTNFLKTADLTLHEIPPTVTEQILAGEKTILDVPVIKETEAVKGRAEKVKEAAGISDNDMSALKTLGGGLALAGVAYQGENIIKVGKKVADVTVKAGKYVEELTHLRPGQIRKFLSSKDVGANLKNIESLETDIAELKSKIKNAKGIDKLDLKDRLLLKKDEKLLSSKTAEIDKIKDSMSKRWAKKFKTKPRVISSLFKRGTTDKWNLWKAKAGLPKLGQRYAIGSILTDKVFKFELEGAPRIAVDIGAGYVAEKMTVKKFFPQLKRIIQSPKGQQFLLKFMAKNTVKKIGTAAVLGGGYLSLATSLIGAGLAVKDIYNIVKNYNEEEE